MIQHDIVIIGGGPAGLAAAAAAKKSGAEDILILERDSVLGGCLLYTSHPGQGFEGFFVVVHFYLIVNHGKPFHIKNQSSPI